MSKRVERFSSSQIDQATVLKLYQTRSDLVNRSRGSVFWEALDPKPKTLLNLYFYTDSSAVTVVELSQLQSQLGHFFERSPLEIRRSIALLTRDLSRAEPEPPRPKPAINSLRSPSTNEKGEIVSVSGNTYDFTSIYTTYFPSIWNQLYRIYNNPEKARDDAQEVFAKFWAKAGTLTDPDLQVGPYLYQMARNMATDQIRRDNLIYFTPISKLVNNPEEENPFDFLAEKGGTDVIISDDDYLIKKEYHEAIYEAMSWIPPSYRWVIQLVDFDQLSIEDTGEVLGRSRSATKSLHYRAKQEFRRQILRLDLGKNLFENEKKNGKKKGIISG